MIFGLVRRHRWRRTMINWEKPYADQDVPHSIDALAKSTFVRDLYIEYSDRNRSFSWTSHCNYRSIFHSRPFRRLLLCFSSRAILNRLAGITIILKKCSPSLHPAFIISRWSISFYWSLIVNVSVWGTAVLRISYSEAVIKWWSRFLLDSAVTNAASAAWQWSRKKKLLFLVLSPMRNENARKKRRFFTSALLMCPTKNRRRICFSQSKIRPTFIEFLREWNWSRFPFSSVYAWISWFWLHPLCT